MKNFYLVLLTLGLTLAFSASAMAVDVKVSGEYFAAGLYQDKTTVQKDQGTSTAFYYQRLRAKVEFTVSPGLTLTTRADIMERGWGATRSAATSSTYNTATSIVTTVSAPTMYDSAGTRAENENISFDWLYLNYVSPVGIFTVGYVNDYAWGTVFGDRSKPDPKIMWTGIFGSTIVGLQIVKEIDKSASAVQTATGANDIDFDGYIAFVKYTFKTGEIGYLFRHNRNATLKMTPAYGNMAARVFSNVPYFKVKLGPVAIEGEATYAFGDYDYMSYPNAKIDSWAAYLNAVADFGVAYVGGTFAWLPGQDPNTDRQTAILTGGTDWNPCLILFNYERSYWGGSIAGYGGSAINTDGVNGPAGMTNAYFFQVKGGVRPVNRLDVNLSVSYANAVVKPSNAWLYNDYGWEIDASATYKITNNLSYMLGAGYLFTGKYFKGTSDTNTDLQDDYLILNKLTLTF